MVSMWISVYFRINPFIHEVNDSSICLRIYSVVVIMQSKQQNFIQTTRPTLYKLARPPSWNDHSFSGTRQWYYHSDKIIKDVLLKLEDVSHSSRLKKTSLITYYLTFCTFSFEINVLCRTTLSWRHIIGMWDKTQ